MPPKEKQTDVRTDLTAGFVVEKAAKDLEYGEVEVIVSNSAKDRHGESILLEGIDLSQIKRNGVVLWAHDYGGLPIARIIKIWKSGGNLMARVKFAHDVYDFADTVYQMVLKEFVKAVSIGGLVKEWNEDYTVIKKLEMIEFSFVPIGAHQDALVTAKSLGLTSDQMKKQYEEFMHKSLVDKFKGIPQNEIEQHIKGLKALMSALETSYTDYSTDTENKSQEPKKTIKKLIVVRQAAKQCDKQAELLISAINKEFKV